MADILIKGLELPTEERISLSIYPNGIVVNHSTLKVENNRTTAIELPPHGRLGDLDALSETIEYSAFWDDSDHTLARDIVKYAPTIIEASKETD